MNLVFVKRCVEANGDDINEMKDIPQQQGISTAHFIETVAKKAGIDKEVLDMLGYDSKRAFAKDWHMTAAKSLYQGIPCYYVVHSAIEYIFVDEADVHKVLNLAQAQERQHRLSSIGEMFDDALAELKDATPNPSEKDYFELMRRFHATWKGELEALRIPMGAFAQYQCEHSKTAAAFDRKFFGKAEPAPSHSTLSLQSCP
ncbi:hypothetical protein [Pseudomonas sp. S1(2024)]|uniref:hypothetical protein n=1 Tax=Pseudomonas sp. S1(2024) TaxID=3390191 RepID=UPI00397DCE97